MVKVEYSLLSALHKKPEEINVRVADMWSFAILLFELETREVPFADLSPMEIGMKVGNIWTAGDQFSQKVLVINHLNYLVVIRLCIVFIIDFIKKTDDIFYEENGWICVIFFFIHESIVSRFENSDEIWRECTANIVSRNMPESEFHINIFIWN